MPDAPITSREFTDDRAARDDSMPSDRLRVVEVDGQYRVAELQRSRLLLDDRTFPNPEAAEQRREALVDRVDAGHISPGQDWETMPRQHADRFVVREVDGQFHAAYVGSRNTFLSAEPHATIEDARKAVDELQRSAAHGNQVDLRSDAWQNADHRKTQAQSPERTNRYHGDDFRIVEQAGRHAIYYHDQRLKKTFTDRAEAELALERTWTKLEAGGQLDEKQWPRVAPEKMPAPDTSKLPTEVQKALDAVAKEPTSKELYLAAVDTAREHLQDQLRPLSSREQAKVLETLATIEHTQSLRDHQRELRREMARTPPALESRRAELERQIRSNGRDLAALPATDEMHHQLAGQLSGKQIDSATLLQPDANLPLRDGTRRLLQNDQFRDQARRHLDRIGQYQRNDLPRAMVLSHLIQHKGHDKLPSVYKQAMASLARRGASLRKLASKVTTVMPAVSITLSAHHQLRRTIARAE